jgi:hypothetical protein
MYEQMFMTKSEVVGQPSVLSIDLVQILKDGSSQFQNFHVNSHKLCTRWILKILIGVHKIRGWLQFGFDFSEQYHKDSDEFVTSYK